MRYAMYMKDLTCNQEMVAKIPKNLDPKSYNLQTMQKDVECIFLCS